MKQSSTFLLETKPSIELPLFISKPRTDIFMYTLLMVYIFVGPVQSDHVFSGVVSIFLFQIDSCIASVGMVRWKIR